ncbi:MAG: response regulator [Gammaproteobacteria bacterium]|nr:response regulator [Gammaproteobacteria bacterium]
MIPDKKAKILIVDDESSNIDVLSSILRGDYKVIAATSGIKGLQLAQRSPQPDLILLDIKMSGLDGYETCKELKNNPETKDIPIVFVTADTDIKSEEKGLLLGAVDYVTKPFNSMLVKARVRNHILLKQSQDNLQQKIIEATTELQHERENLAKSEKLYRSLMEAAPDTILLVNEQGYIEMANVLAESMFGYTQEELVGKEIELLVPDEYVKDHYQQRDSFLKNPVIRNRVTLGRLSGRRKNGEVFPVDISLSPIETENGTMIIADIRDMTEEHSMQAQLRQAQKMEAIGQLTGGIAHDFNNILNSILGFSDIALRDKTILDNDNLKKYLDIISQSGMRARDLVKQMLAYSRGNFDGNFQVMNIAPVMHEVMRMLRPVLPASINFELDIDNDVPLILADSLQINQIIMNMCINARDALHEKGSIYLSLKKKNVSNEVCSSCQKILNGEFVEIVIRDGGEGISEDNIKKIFDPFFTTKEVGKGTGMGLAVVHGIVHNHNGHIVVGSKPGEGTIFRLLLPHVQKKPAIQQANNESSDVKLDGHAALAVVVDDDVDIGALLEELLIQNNFEVKVFSSSKEALAYFEKHSEEIDLVITDQTMPEMNGYEMSKVMLDIRQDIPIIMQTGYSSIVDEKSARALGIKVFLNKPLEQRILLREIKNIMHL